MAANPRTKPPRRYVELTEVQASKVVSVCAGILAGTRNWLLCCPEWEEILGVRRRVWLLNEADCARGGLGLFRPDNLAACILVKS